MRTDAIVLGQMFGAGESAAVPELPAPPPLTHYALENPWPALGGCLILAALAFWLVLSGRAEGRKWLRLLGLGALVAGVGVLSAARMVKTDRETLVELTGVLVDAAARAEAAELTAMLGSDVALRVLGGEARYTRDQILDLVRKYPGTNPIDWHTIDRSAAVMDGRDLGRTQVRVRVRSKATTMYDVPIGSWWRVSWRRSGGAWQVSGLECLQIDGVAPGTRP
ncbi:MAG: hypothetical protein ACK4WH_10975 [Phycisphaerales bacterium]